jgi:hypothetical protein
VYTDIDFVVLYHCTRVLADGTCAPLQHYVTVLSKSNVISSLNMDKLKGILNTWLPKLCADPDQMETVKHSGKFLFNVHMYINTVLHHYNADCGVHKRKRHVLDVALKITIIASLNTCHRINNKYAQRVF